MGSEAAASVYGALSLVPVPACLADVQDGTVQRLLRPECEGAGQEYARPECHRAWSGGRSR